MIARIWRGHTRAEDAESYTKFIERTGLADYRATPGNVGAAILRRVTPQAGDVRRPPSPRLLPNSWCSRSGRTSTRSGVSPGPTPRRRTTTPRTTITSSARNRTSRTMSSRRVSDRCSKASRRNCPRPASPSGIPSDVPRGAGPARSAPRRLLPSQALAGTEPQGFPARREREPGRLAARPRPALHLGPRAARGVLEVRRAADADGREARNFRAQGEQLVLRARGGHGKGVEGRSWRSSRTSIASSPTRRRGSRRPPSRRSRAAAGAPSRTSSTAWRRTTCTTRDRSSC